MFLFEYEDLIVSHFFSIQISSETILDEIRQRQLGDFVCSLSFTNRNQLHQELTAQIQREIPDLQVEYFRVEYLNDIPSLPWAKTFLIFFDLKQKNGIDPIKGTDDIKLIVVKAVQRMGGKLRFVCLFYLALLLNDYFVNHFLGMTYLLT